MPTVTLNLPDTTFVSSALPGTNFLFYPLIYVGTDNLDIYLNALIADHYDLEELSAENNNAKIRVY